MDNNPQAGQSNVWLYLTVFITGASVMVIELLGHAPDRAFLWSQPVRVVFPYLGYHDCAGGRLFFRRILGRPRSTQWSCFNYCTGGFFPR